MPWRLICFNSTMVFTCTPFDSGLKKINRPPKGAECAQNMMCPYIFQLKNLVIHFGYAYIIFRLLPSFLVPVDVNNSHKGKKYAFK